MSGFEYFLKGFKLLGRPGIRPFVILPIAINLLIFAVLTWVLVDQTSALTAWLEQSLGDWMSWLIWLVWLVVGILWLVIYGFSFSLISYTLAAPFYGLLAEKVQAQLSGEGLGEPVTAAAMAAMVKRTLVREGQKLLYILPRVILLAVISIPLYFIPVLGIAVPVIWFVWGAWSLALENIDYAADNNQMPFPAMKKAMARRRMLSLSFGSAAVIASSIPLFNLIAVPAAVAGGTSLWLDHWHTNDNSSLK